MLIKTKKITQFFVAIFAVIFVFTTPASATTHCTNGAVLTFPAWYDGLALDSDCHPQLTKLNDLWVIALNLVEVLLQVVAYAPTGFLIWGGFKYMKSRGDPARIQNAKDAILNAMVGLGISLGSVAIVNFISKRIAGTGNVANVPIVNAGAGQLNSVMSNIVFPIAGAVCVVFIIIGGIQYTTSNGDPGQTKRAKDTLIYSVVGLVFVVMAFAIVQLILGRFQ